MTTSPENIERLKKIAMISIPAVLGAMAVKNIREKSMLKHVSYWEASQSFIIDLMEDGVQKTVRLSGTVRHGKKGRQDVEDVEIFDGFEYEESDIARLEAAFPDRQIKED